MQELGEPAMYTAIALGVGRMSTAMVGLATSTTAAVTAGRLLQSTLPGLAAMAGFTLAKAYADSRNLESEGKEIKSLVTYGHEGARMRYMGTTPQNLDALEDVKIMHYIKDKLPGYTAEQYAAFIREGGIQFKKVTDSAFNEWWYKVQVNDSAVKRALDGMQSRPVRAIGAAQNAAGGGSGGRGGSGSGSLKSAAIDSVPSWTNFDEMAWELSEMVDEAVGGMAERAIFGLQSGAAIIADRYRASNSSLLGGIDLMATGSGDMTPSQQRQFDEAASLAEWEARQTESRQRELVAEQEFYAMREEIRGSSLAGC
jgi:hypothetical protein